MLFIVRSRGAYEKLGLIFLLVDTGTVTVTITLAYDVDIQNTCSVDMEFVCFQESTSY